LAKPTIENLGVAAVNNKKIRRLDIPVNDAFRVRSVQPIRRSMATSSNHLVDAPADDRCFRILASRYSNAICALPCGANLGRRGEPKSRTGGPAWLIDLSRERRGLWHNNCIGVI